MMYNNNICIIYVIYKLYIGIYMCVCTIYVIYVYNMSYNIYNYIQYVDWVRGTNLTHEAFSALKTPILEREPKLIVIYKADIF